MNYFRNLQAGKAPISFDNHVPAVKKFSQGEVQTLTQNCNGFGKKYPHYTI